MNRVLCNVLYNTYLNAYMMLCFSDYDWGTYLYTCTNLETQQWSSGIMIDNMPSTEFGIRLVGRTGDDKEGDRPMMIYIRESNYPGFNTILEERSLWLE